MHKLRFCLFLFCCFLFSNAQSSNAFSQENQTLNPTIKNVIFDHDGSNDDMIALMYLSCHPNINLKAITIPETGEVSGDKGAQNTADLCLMLGFPDIPIAYSSQKSLDDSGAPFPSFLRELINGLLKGKNVPRNMNPSIFSDAVSLMQETLLNNPSTTILATGPLTNVAQLIQKNPELCHKIERIIIMGGAVDVIGNIQALDPESTNYDAEWNFYADPRAAQIVLNSSIPVTLVPLDATNLVPLTREFYEELERSTSTNAKVIYAFLKDVIDSFGMELFLNHYYLWDPLAAMICADPTLVKTTPMVLDIDLNTAKVIKSNHGKFTDVVTHINKPNDILNTLIETIS